MRQTKDISPPGHNHPARFIIIVMGVSGVGKTTVASLLAQRLGAVFVEGDSFHPTANVRKMRQNQPLTDTDRVPWLDRLAKEIIKWKEDNRSVVLACSALKARYREILGGQYVRYVYLTGSENLIRQRMDKRSGHFMPSSLLGSQFSDLEEPEEAIIVNVKASPEEIVSTILDQLLCSHEH